MKKLIVANWKMMPESLAQAQEILESINDHLGSLRGGNGYSLVFCPPFVFLEEVGKILKMSHLEDPSFLGAQDIAIDEGTALTGEVSGSMLALACSMSSLATRREDGSLENRIRS